MHTSGYDRQLNPQPPAHVFQRYSSCGCFLLGLMFCGSSELRRDDGRAVMSGFGLGSAAGAVSPKLASLYEREGDFMADSCWDAE